MTLVEREKRIVAELAVLPDPHERLTYLMQRAAARPRLPEAARVEGARVPGCVSRVWLTGQLRDGQCHFMVDAESPMVLGLMGLLCEVYDGSTPDEAAAAVSEVLSLSGLDRTLSPTRLQGMAHARSRLRQIAAGLAEPSTGREEIITLPEASAAEAEQPLAAKVPSPTHAF